MISVYGRSHLVQKGRISKVFIGRSSYRSDHENHKDHKDPLKSNKPPTGSFQALPPKAPVVDVAQYTQKYLDQIINQSFKVKLQHQRKDYLEINSKLSPLMFTAVGLI